VVANKFIFFLAIVIGFSACSEEPKQGKPKTKEQPQIIALNDPALIPLPIQIDETGGPGFTLSNSTSFYAFGVSEDDKAVRFFMDNILGSNAKVINMDTTSGVLDTAEKESVIFSIDSRGDTNVTSDEYYELEVSNGMVILHARTSKGLFMGIQTLRQLMPNNVKELLKNGDRIHLSGTKIVDHPKFKWRGMLLDCCRHFFSKDVVKKYIDLLAYYKMNTLHWHLTEDQGWRIQIDKYPKLTEIGAYRNDTLLGENYGGFYTKADIREIVAYAEERFINVVPEIELPGHSQAALAAYPHLSCTGGPFEVANDWGVFKDIYCAGNDSVFTFLEDVLTEVIELFPGKYIHIGGDEAPKYRWENCSKCQGRMVAEGVKDEHELQLYFISRIGKFLESKGKKMIGWDEILEGGLAEGAIVQSWRGFEGATEAAHQGHQAIVSPTSHAYFDYDIKTTNLEKVYSFNPIPDALPEDQHHYILGGECNMWTEHVPDEATLDSKVFPRLLAMSEVLWNGKEDRDYDEFLSRVYKHYPILESMRVNAGLEAVPVKVTIDAFSEDMVIIKFEKQVQNITIQYRVDDRVFADGQEQFTVSKACRLAVQAYRDGVPVGEPVVKFAMPTQASNKIPKLKYPYSEWYTGGGENGLTNAQLGTLDFRDGNWQGFWGTPLEATIDLGEEKEITSIGANFYQYNNAWIFLPHTVTFSTSVDGHIFTKWREFQTQTPPEKRGKLIEKYEVAQAPIKVRYIEVSTTNFTKVPDWHEAAGSDAWIFIDEIMVK
jgi:hexosaminidase